MASKEKNSGQSILKKTKEGAKILKTIHFPFYLILLIAMTGCFLFQDDDDNGPPEPIDVDLLAPNDKARCDALASSDNTVTVSGEAVFEYRVPGAKELSRIAPEPKKIRFAEIEVFTSNEECVTYGQTDAQGSFSFNLPYENTPVSYIIRVNSRADNQHIKISVQDDPLNYQHHFVAQTITLQNNQPMTGIVIKALADKEGGAFNIYDQILEANLFLRQASVNCSTYMACTPFTVAPKVYVYWKKGFNPVTYIRNTKSSFSFYLPNRGQLFIVGGSNGDISISNTDHFDNTIILHEYGHFLEDHISKTDSPGGSHSANSVIDPRLAWSEGFATFFANAVSGQPVYIDSYGTAGQLQINEDLEKHPPDRDVPKKPGEGNFREFSIARALWDIIDPYTLKSEEVEDKDEDGVSADFAELYSVFAGAFKDGQYYFRDYGLFMQLHSQIQNKTDLTTIFEREQQKPNREDFAAPFPANRCPKTIKAQDLDRQERTLFLNYPAVSDQHGSNDFYLYQHFGGKLSVQLTYEPTQGQSPKPDANLDLYVYKNHYFYQKQEDILASSTNPDDDGMESIEVEAPAGVYMLNVLVFTRRGNNNLTFELGSESTYNLIVNGVFLCP